MATLYIEEYTSLARDGEGHKVPVAGELVAAQKKAIGAASADSNALNARTEYVVLTADAVCQWEEAASPTADANSRFLSAGSARAFQVTAGNVIAVIEQQ